jgi:hypothetical protein
MATHQARSIHLPDQTRPNHTAQYTNLSLGAMATIANQSTDLSQNLHKGATYITANMQTKLQHCIVTT